MLLCTCAIIPWFNIYVCPKSLFCPISVVFPPTFVHFRDPVYPSSVSISGYSGPAPVPMRKYGNENGRGVFPPVTVHFQQTWPECGSADDAVKLFDGMAGPNVHDDDELPGAERDVLSLTKCELVYISLHLQFLIHLFIPCFASPSPTP